MAPRHLSVDEEQRVRRWVAAACGYPFNVEIHYVDSVSRSPCGKFEDFVCLVESAATTELPDELAESVCASVN